MFSVKFNVFDYEDNYEISHFLSIDSIMYISPLKSIPPGWGFCVHFSEEEKVYFLLKYGDKISEWREEIIEEVDEEDEEDW